MDPQIGMFDKFSLGFNVSQNQNSQKIYENFFIPQNDKLRCSFCDKYGHHESFFFHRKRTPKVKSEHFILEHSSQYSKCSSLIKIKECSY